MLFGLTYPGPAAAAAKSLQSCPTLCDPIDGSPPGSPVPGILQARTLEWVAISFSNAWTWKVKVKSLSRVRPSATPWTAAHQAPPPLGFPGRSTGVGAAAASTLALEPCCSECGPWPVVSASPGTWLEGRTSLLHPPPYTHLYPLTHGICNLPRSSGDSYGP